MAKKTIRIGNAGGYWGDDPTALKRQIFGGKLDYVSMDFLAEITMSIMQKQKSRDPKAGYAADFLSMLEDVFVRAINDGTKIISNAGGVNPEACAAAIRALAKRLGLKPKIAVVYGDDILSDVANLRKSGAEFRNMETGEDFASISERVLAANVYFGAAPVVAALATGADVIVTGRVTDTGITLAPFIHEFGWRLDDWNRLASGIIAGHMIECGCQVSGGNFSDWHLVPSFDQMGFPIVEMEESGEFVITKHPNTGGLISVDTVREQVVYEMGDPKAYITPDVVADFSTIQLASDGQNRVRVSGIKGQEPTALYKVSMAYQDGYKVVSSIIISGPAAPAKAKVFADIFWKKCELPLTAKDTEFFGFNACHASLAHQTDASEIRLRLGARANDQGTLKLFSKLVPSLILSGPPGVAVTGGANKPTEVVSYWPALLDKSLVRPKVGVFDDNSLIDAKYVDTTASASFRPPSSEGRVDVCERASLSVAAMLKDFASADGHPLSSICLGRSGDKGDTCNIGILARSEESYNFLKQYLTADRVKNWFQELCHGKVVRYQIDGLMALNFLLESALGGGGTKTMRSDAQGKMFAQALIRQKVVIPESVLNSVKGLRR
jgi:hypothetical protein